MKLRDLFISWQKVDLPVPGVPVTRMFGTLRGMCSSAIIVDYYNEEENRKDEYTYDHGECCL